MEMNISYGSAHSKHYKPQLVESLTICHDCDNNAVKKHTDIYLMLRQKALTQESQLTILRDYMSNIQIREIRDQQLTDEQLHSIVNFRDINTITDAYEYSQFLAKNQNKLRDGYNKIKALVNPKTD